jgi:hypothetical protein
MNKSNGSGTNNEKDEEWLVIDPRLVALGATPLTGLVDMWYGTSSVSAKFDSVTLTDLYPLVVLVCDLRLY